MTRTAIHFVRDLIGEATRLLHGEAPDVDAAVAQLRIALAHLEESHRPRPEKESGQ